jgi:hypothetical protein
MSYETRENPRKPAKTRESCAKHRKPTAISKKSSSDRKAESLLKYYIFLKYYAAAQVTLCERSELYVSLKPLLNIMRFLKFICSFTTMAAFTLKAVSGMCRG